MQLRTQLPGDSLQAAYLSSPRNDIKNFINQLKNELETVIVEQSELEDKEAAAIATEIIDGARPKLDALQKSFEIMEDAIDTMLSYYGEAPTADLEEFLRNVDKFITQYEDAYADFRDAIDRKKRREELEQKRVQRCADLQNIQKLQDERFSMSLHKSQSKSTKNFNDKDLNRKVSFGAGTKEDQSSKRGALSTALKRVASGRALETTVPLRSLAENVAAKRRVLHHTDFDDDDDDDFDDDDGFFE